MDALIAIFTFLYLFWPLIIVFGFRELFRKDHGFFERIRLSIQQVFTLWVILAFFLAYIYIQGQEPIVFLSKAIDHLLFGILGAITGGITLGWGLYQLRKKRIRLSDAQDLEDLLALSPEGFESLVAVLFQTYGYDAEVSESHSDHGVDVYVSTQQGEKWVVQCKRYSGSVGEPVIRDLYGTMLHEGAQRAYLITTGSFTVQAKAWVAGKPIVLYDGDALVKLINRTQKNQKRISPSG